MNTIKVYFDSSGRIETLEKDFPLYQGQFQNVLLNIYVPTAILAPDYTIQNYVGQKTFARQPIQEELDSFVFQQTGRTAKQGDTVYAIVGESYYVCVKGKESFPNDYAIIGVTSFPPIQTGTTTVNVGSIAVQRNGVLYKSKTYATRYIKTFQYKGIDYALYERKLPKTFTSLEGVGNNAPKMIINIVNIDKANNGLVESLITSQTCRLEVLPSTILDRDEPIEPSELNRINGILNDLSDKKQDKQIDNATTENKTVLGAINELDANTGSNSQAVQGVRKDLNDLTERVGDLELLVDSGEFYVGTLKTDRLPSIETLNNFVLSTVGRPTQKNDTIIVVVDSATTHAKTYKYRYNGQEWSYYLIPTVEPATNEEWGSVKGNFDDTNEQTKVNIVNGIIKQVLIKKNNGLYQDVAQEINSQEVKTQGIINGSIIVGKSAQAINDSENRPITETYITKDVGATKEYVRDYALPNTFNDAHYLSFEGNDAKYVSTKQEDSLSSAVSGLGEKKLFEATYELQEEFQLSENNQYNSKFYIGVDLQETAYFKLNTYYKKVGFEKRLLAQQILPPQTLSGIVEINFNSNLTEIKDNVISLTDGDIISQELIMVRSVSLSNIITCYANSALTSVFYLTTVAKTVVYESANKGEIDILRTSSLILDRDSYVAEFTLPQNVELNEFSEYMFEIPFTNSLEERNLVYLREIKSGTLYTIQTPYDIGTATIKLLAQTKSADNVFRFVAVLKNGKFVVEQSNLSTVEVDISGKVDKVGQQEQVYATDGLGRQTSLPYNVTPYGGGIAKRTGDGRLKANDGTEADDLSTISQLKTRQSEIIVYAPNTYSQGAIVSYGNVLYKSLKDNNTDTPDTDGSWQKITGAGESGLIPRGSTTYEGLPATPNADNFKSLWNITNDFTTDDRFAEGAGKKHSAGTDVASIQEADGSYKYDVIGSFVDLSNYFTKSEVSALTDANAQAITDLQGDVAANNADINTINKQIDDDGFVMTTPQDKMSPEKETQARKNIDVLSKGETEEIALTLKETENITEITDTATFQTYFYNLRKSRRRKYQFEISQGVNTNIILAVGGYPNGVPTGTSGFIYVELPYSEAGGFEIDITFMGRNSNYLYKRTMHATLNSAWQTTPWVNAAKADDTASVVGVSNRISAGSLTTTLYKSDDTSVESSPVSLPTGGTILEVDELPEIDYSVAPTIYITGALGDTRVFFRQRLVSTVGLEYALGKLVGRGTATEAEIIIANTYMGSPVTIIDSFAFNKDKVLTGVIFADTNRIVQGYAFANSNLKTLYTNKLEKIQEDSFEYCAMLETIRIGKQLQTLQYNALLKRNPFIGSTALKTITVDKENTFFSDKDSNCIFEIADKKILTGVADSLIPADTKIIGRNAFYRVQLANPTLPEGLEIIEDYAFGECKTFPETLVLPTTLTKIGQAAFGSTNIVSVNINVPTVGSAFGTPTLKTVVIGKDVVSLGVNELSFNDYTNPFNTTFDSITVDSGNNIFTGDGNYVYDTKNKVLLAGNNKISSIPADTKILAGNCLMDLILPATLTLPEGLTTIESYALNGSHYADRSTAIVIPSSVTLIKQFGLSRSANNIKMKSAVPPEIDSTSALPHGFLGSVKTIYVPVGSLNAYKTATNWKQWEAENEYQKIVEEN